jgi:hypothetical protein
MKIIETTKTVDSTAKNSIMGLILKKSTILSRKEKI